MQSNKLGTMFIISMLSLSAIGITYAGWTDLITVSGTVQTGNVEFEIIDYSGTWVWKDINQHQSIVNKGTVDIVDEDSDGILNDDPNGYYGDPNYELISRAYCYDADPNADPTVDFIFENLYPVNPAETFCVDFVFTIGSIPVILDQALTDFGWTAMDPAGWILADGWYWCILDGDTLIYTTATAATMAITDIIQLHPDIEYTWKLCLSVEQVEETMGATAAGAGTLAIIQWSDNCDPNIPNKILNLFDDPINLQISEYWPGNNHLSDPLQYPYETYFDLNIWGCPVGYDVYDDEWAAFCGDSDLEMGLVAYVATIYESTDPLMPASCQDDEEWDMINYILNNWMNVEPTANWEELQAALWYFADGRAPTGIAYTNYQTTKSDNIIADAIANGAGFIPQTGDWMAVICYINDNTQMPFLVVDP